MAKNNKDKDSMSNNIKQPSDNNNNKSPKKRNSLAELADMFKADSAAKKRAQEKKRIEAQKQKALTDAKRRADKKKREDAKKLAEEKKRENAKKTSTAKKQASKPSEPKKNGIRFIGGHLFKKMALGGATELSNNADEVNKLNVFPVPDGDTGDNMKMTIESGVAAIEGLDTDNLAEVMQMLSRGMLLGARGNSGVILSQFFAGMAKGFEGIEQATPKELGKALEQGVAQAYASVMTPTEGTILTVARESVEYAVKKLHPQSTIKTFFQDLVDEMHASLDRTPELLTALKEAEVVDSGGAGLLHIMEGFNQVINGKTVKAQKPQEQSRSAPIVPTGSFGPDSEMVYGYCTELLLQLQNKKCDIEGFDIEPLKAFLSEIGDSIVAFKTESIVKIHVHTKTPERVLEYCRKYGEFLTVKIENMSVQHSEGSIDEKQEVKPEKKDEAELPAPRKEETAERLKYATVSVCNGEGMINVFRQLGVTEIVVGGQAHNPSTNDFIDAFDRIDAENIFVFPNNGNIQMAAAQAAEMYERARIFVVPSKIVATGYVALSTADFENPDPQAVLAGMTEAIERVCAGYVSPSIRDADIGGVHINNGDTIGIIGKDIVVADADRVTAAAELVKKLLADPYRFMLTVFAGQDADPDEQKKLKEQITAENPDIEIYFVDGGQEIYPYIFLAE